MIFTLISHLVDYILMKVQDIQFTKLMYDQFQKFYEIIMTLQKFILLNKLFNIFYVSADNMYKYVDQLNDHFKILDCLNIFIDSTIVKALVVNHLSNYFFKFQT